MSPEQRAIVEEFIIRKKMERYAKDPLLWLEERFDEDRKSFAWSEFGGKYENHHWDGDKDPIAQAWYKIAEQNWVAISAATGTSKTYWLSRLVYWFLDCFHDSLIVTSAPKEAQLKLHLWSEIGKSFQKFQSLRPESKLRTLRLSLSDADDEENPYDGWQAVGFVAGTGVDEQSATKAQGFHRKNMLIITEETPGMSSGVMTAFQNTSTGMNNIMVAVGNPDSELDELAGFAELENVFDYRISAFDYPNVVLGSEVFPGGVTQPSIDRRADKFGVGSPMYNSRVRGIAPKQGSDSLIRLEWIERAIGNMPNDDIFYYNAAGVDVANSENGDMAAVAYGEGNTLFKLVEFSCPSASDIAYNLIYSKKQMEDIRSMFKRLPHKKTSYINAYLDQKHTDLTDDTLFKEYDIDHLDVYQISPECVGIDGVGVGVSTFNTFENLGYHPTSLQGGGKVWEEAMPTDNEGKPLYRFQNWRAQGYWELAMDFQHGKIGIEIEDKDIIRRLKKELGSIKYVLKENAIAIEKKEFIAKKLGKSPNLADAVMYWNWMRKGYRLRAKEMMPFMTGD